MQTCSTTNIQSEGNITHEYSLTVLHEVEAPLIFILFIYLVGGKGGNAVCTVAPEGTVPPISFDAPTILALLETSSKHSGRVDHISQVMPTCMILLRVSVHER